MRGANSGDSASYLLEGWERGPAIDVGRPINRPGHSTGRHQSTGQGGKLLTREGLPTVLVLLLVAPSFASRPLLRRGSRAEFQGGLGADKTAIGAKV